MKCGLTTNTPGCWSWRAARNTGASGYRDKLTNLRTVTQLRSKGPNFWIPDFFSLKNFPLLWDFNYSLPTFFEGDVNMTFLAGNRSDADSRFFCFHLHPWSKRINHHHHHLITQTKTQTKKRQWVTRVPRPRATNLIEWGNRGSEGLSSLSEVDQKVDYFILTQTFGCLDMEREFQKEPPQQKHQKWCKLCPC